MVYCFTRALKRAYYPGILLTIFCLFCIFHVSGQESSISFNSLTINDGLSQGAVEGIVQDHKGFMWFATKDGLNRYDGYKFEIFKPGRDKEHTIPDNSINALEQSSENMLWIGTESSGLAVYNHSTGKFGHFPLPGSAGSTGLVSALKEDLKGNIWVGGANRQLYKFSPDDSVFTELKLPAGSGFERLVSPRYVSDIARDSTGNMWVAVLGHGLYYINPKAMEVIHHFSETAVGKYGFPLDDITSLSIDNDSVLWIGTFRSFIRMDLATLEHHYFESLFHEMGNVFNIKSILTDNKGHLWIATVSNGLLRFHREEETIEQFIPRHGDDYSLNMRSINKIYADRSGIIWIGTNGKGVNYFSLLKNFKHYPGIPSEKHGILNKSVRAIAKDHEGDIWIGSYSGLDIFHPSTDEITSLPHRTSDYKEIYNKNAYTLFEDSQNRMWMGSEGGGIYLADKSEGILAHYGGDKNEKYYTNFIYDIQECDNGFIWLGTNMGLTRFDPEEEKFELFLDHFENPHTHVINQISKDETGRFWLATNNGIIIFDPYNLGYKTYNNVSYDSTGLNSHRIFSLYHAGDNTVWAGTDGGGVSMIKLDEEHNPAYYRHYTHEQDGLPNNVIYAILPGNDGTIWMSSNMGIIQMDPEETTFRNYLRGDGLQSNEFNAGAFLNTRDGELFFGGINGINSFYPSEIEVNSHEPPMVLTHLSTQHTLTDLDKPYSEITEIELEFDHNLITFEFAALDFHNSPMNQYAYKVDPFGDEWINLGRQRHITFTNLDPGYYTLNVKGANSDMVWNEEGIAIDLLITPPYWQTTWFYMLITFLGISSIAGIIYWRTRSLRRTQMKLKNLVDRRTSEIQKKNLELEKSRLEARKANEAKSHFLASMSHEIRTPMNAVIGLSDLLLNTPLNEEQKDYLQTIQNSGNNLLHIINDILDLSKIESGNMEIESFDFEPGPAMEELTEMLAPKAREKDLDIGCKIDPSVPDVINGDLPRIKQIVTNLLSNAVKFTSKGYVSLEVTAENANVNDEDKIRLHFKVIDTGIGVDETDFNKLFRNFSQVDASTTRNYGGTGLGLAISKRLVNLMDGEINFKSKKGEGSEFYFDILAGKGTEYYITSPRKKPSSLAGENALIISNNQLTASILKTYLEEAGMTVTVMKGDDFLNQPSGSVQPPAVIFADYDTLNHRPDPAKFYNANNPACIYLSYKPANHQEGLVLKKPVKRSSLWTSLKKGLKIDDQAPAESTYVIGGFEETLGNTHPLKILLAEDNEVNQKVIFQQLNKSGYTITIVNNGREAVEEVMRSDYDLILMDIQMPEMDGLEATREIKKGLSNKKCPVIIALTANALEEDRKHYLEEGLDDCIVKPVQISTLQAKLKYWFKKEKL